MECGNCGGTDFEVFAGRRVCQNCSAEVDNEVAAALDEGLEGGEEE